MPDAFSERGFLPESDPLNQFPAEYDLNSLDELGRDLPSILLEKDGRQLLKQASIPLPPEQWTAASHLALLRLYYVRIGFIVSGYVNQIGQPACNEIPKNLALPLVDVCKRLGRPPILSYDGYALYNWRRFDKNKAIELGNIDTIQNFVHLYDEHWFILIHIDIEKIAAEILGSIQALPVEPPPTNDEVNHCLTNICSAMERMIKVLKRIPEKMSSEIYFRQFRPYIRFFEGVTYEGCDQASIDHRGETGAQSSIMPALSAFLKIPYQETELIRHLREMRTYMPSSHREFIEYLEERPSIKSLADPKIFDDLLELIAEFRHVHLDWAQQYINRHESDPRGTGGTPYMQWLNQLIEETRAYKYHHKS